MSNISWTALTLSLLVTLPAAADDSKSANPTSRQMAHCVMARVKTTPSESYKVAFKACRDQFGAANDARTQTAMNNAIEAWDRPKN
jgi:hypothetical protein